MIIALQLLATNAVSTEAEQFLNNINYHRIAGPLCWIYCTANVQCS